MTKPTIHLNGTSRKDLLEAYINACDAMRQAIEAVAAAAPNARDYYVQPGDAYVLARREHEFRLSFLNQFLKELSGLAEHVAGEL